MGVGPSTRPSESHGQAGGGGEDLQWIIQDAQEWHGVQGTSPGMLPSTVGLMV